MVPIELTEFLTNRGMALAYLAEDPDIRLRDLGDRIGISERAAHRIVKALVDDGYITRERIGRRSRYTVNGDLPLLLGVRSQATETGA